jgi:hypothetical protein
MTDSEPELFKRTLVPGIEHAAEKCQERFEILSMNGKSTMIFAPSVRHFDKLSAGSELSLILRS